jgi:hypothetical protein
MPWAKGSELKVLAVVGECRRSLLASSCSWLFGQTAGDVEFEL